MRKKAKKKTAPEASLWTFSSGTDKTAGKSAESSWKQTSGVRALEAPKPVQFTARQLAYVHSLLATQANFIAHDDRGDERTKRVVNGAINAVHAVMRDWWDAIEAAGVGTYVFSFTVTDKPVKAEKAECSNQSP